jgi:hypothetical protein
MHDIAHGIATRIALHSALHTGRDTGFHAMQAALFRLNDILTKCL